VLSLVRATHVGLTTEDTEVTEASRTGGSWAAELRTSVLSVVRAAHQFTEEFTEAVMSREASENDTLHRPTEIL